MTELNARFQRRDAFQSNGYRLLPFRFTRLHGDDYVLTNDVGEYAVLSRETLERFGTGKLHVDDEVYATLKSRHFLFDDGSTVALDLLALKYRTRAATTAEFTGLHIFVVTLRCDHSCHYCQVSRQSEDRANFDMSKRHAEVALEHVFRSPSRTLKIEFQGGEPLLNFDVIQYVVERAKAMNVTHRRNLTFVIASNLSRLSDEVLAFCRAHDICLSTSLDGPEELHNPQRPVPNRSSYRLVVEGIQKARRALGPDRVAALMTTTPASLSKVEAIIDEYVRLDFHSVFLRSLSPFGFATKSLVRKYTPDDWFEFYRRGLGYVVSLNRAGYPLREEYTSILLHRMFAPTGSGYVDLQSPAGIGIAAIVYNYDGGVYASDEGRMLAEMGDETFRLGHLDTHSYEDLLTNDFLVQTLSDTMLEGVPMCTDCAFLPYCGADPVFHMATQKNTTGHKAFSAFCSKQMSVLRHVIELLESDEATRSILMGWI